MTVEPRFERQLPALLEDLYLGPSPDYRDTVLAVATQRRQRPAWTFPGRWLPMDIATRAAPVSRLPLRQIGVLALIVVLLAVALAFAVGTRQRVPPPFGPARNGLMLYGSGGDIYALDPATGDATGLVTGPATDRIPFYSRDGTRLVFFRQIGTGATYQLVVANADGTGQRVVSTDPVTFDYSINWSADGRSIIVDDGRGHLTRLDTVGNAPPEKVTYAGVADIVALRPPDEGQLLYRTVTAEGSSIWIVDIDGTHAHPLIPGAASMREGDYTGYQWSPDGSRVAFRMHPDESDALRIFIVNADGTGLRRLTRETGTECECDMFWSPDSKQIAFNRWRLDPASGDSHVRPVGIAAVDDGAVRDIGPQPPDDNGIDFAFSPDGTTITWLPRRGPESTGAPSVNPILVDIADGTSRTVSIAVDSPPDWQRLAR